jgi:Domain of Unknown Function (DUF748)
VALPSRTRLVVLALAAAALVAAVFVAYRAAMAELKTGIEAALGPRASLGAIELGMTGVEVRDLRIRAARGAWPTEDELRAARVHLRPALSTLWAPGWRIGRIEVADAYVSLQRSRDGRLRILPALLEQPASKGPKEAGTKPHVHIAQVLLKNASIDFHDASVRQPAHRMLLDQLDADVGPLDWPALDTAAQVDLDARFRGPQRDGRLTIAGTLTPATRDARLKAEARGVDLVALQPYLLKVNEGGVRRGTLDLGLDATVKAQRLHAPGKLTLTGLELGPSGGLLSTFAGVPRQAVLAAMSRDGRIVVSFTLDGRLDDPSFSINENFATKLAGGLAETLGVSIGGVVEGVGNVIKGLFGK